MNLGESKYLNIVVAFIIVLNVVIMIEPSFSQMPATGIDVIDLVEPSPALPDPSDTSGVTLFPSPSPSSPSACIDSGSTGCDSSTCCNDTDICNTESLTRHVCCQLDGGNCGADDECCNTIDSSSSPATVITRSCNSSTNTCCRNISKRCNSDYECCSGLCNNDGIVSFDPNKCINLTASICDSICGGSSRLATDSEKSLSHCLGDGTHFNRNCCCDDPPSPPPGPSPACIDTGSTGCGPAIGGGRGDVNRCCNKDPLVDDCIADKCCKWFGGDCTNSDDCCFGICNPDPAGNFCCIESGRGTDPSTGGVHCCSGSATSGVCD